MGLDQKHSNNQNHSSGNHTRSYLFVFLALLLLTFITVKTAGANLGRFQHFALLIAMAIAIVKGTLVCLYFMHLRHDILANKVAFLSSLIFFVALVVLTLTDFLTRPGLGPLSAIRVAYQTERLSPDQIKKMIPSSVESIQRGKVLYANNCATCHGKNGAGDGKVSNPPPRNFTSSEGWKNPTHSAGIFSSISKGLNETGMPPWQDALSIEERWDLVHYVRSLVPNPQEDTEETIIALSKKMSKTRDPELPISFAMDRLLQEVSQP